jgi:predicted enzyme related to lactoylglutathione lyase
MPTRDSSPNGGPCWVDLATSDPERARDFYGQLFGWTFDGTGDYTDCLRNGARAAGIAQNTEDSGYPDAWTTYFASADAEQTAALADDSGGQSVRAPLEIPMTGTTGLLVDPGGALVGVWQPGEHTGFQVVGEPGSAVWHELHTRHYQASVLFYETVFGWSTSVESDTDQFRYTTAQFGGMSLAGIMDATGFLSEDAPASWQVYFGTTDVDATIAQAEALGGTVVDQPDDSPYGRLATLADPTGARFKVMTPVE